MSGLRLVADDLTGALDSAAAFRGARGPIAVCLALPADSFDAALDLACRDGTQDAAVAAAVRARAFLAGAEVAYFKIDSLLRGHWAAMLAALWRGGGFARCVLAPAFPAQGRITEGGRQFVRAPDGSRQLVCVDPRAALAAHGVTLGQGVKLYDATGQQDLQRLVERVRVLPGTLWCGAAGLAAALAGAPAPRVAQLPGPILAIVGSCHPVSESQVAHLRDLTGHAPLHLRGDANEPVAVTARCQDHGFCVLRAEIPPGTPADRAAELIAHVLVRLLPSLPPPGTLVVSGGETLRAACQALGAAHLTVEAEVAAGIPFSRLRGGAWDGVAVVSKSGAFGAADLLARLLVRSGAFTQ